MDQIGSEINKSEITPNDADCEESRTSSLMDSVFGNHLLREMIISRVISSSTVPATARSHYDNICSLRLVNKTWLIDTNKLHALSRKPLCYLNLDVTNSLNNSAFVWENGQKELERFMNVMNHSVNGNIPPFRLTINKDFFCDENYQNFLDFLGSKWVEKLIELDVTVPKNGGSLPFVFPHQFLFPRLNKITVKFCKGILPAPDNSTDGGVKNERTNSNFLPFIQSIVDGSENLGDFVLSCERDGLLPAAFKYLILPASLTSLSIDCPLNSIHLEIMQQNSFPHLTHLRLQVTKVATRNDLLFKMLDHVKATLVHFSLHNDPSCGHSGDTVHMLQFPVMKRLESLDLRSMHIKLETHAFVPLQNFLPKLKNVNLAFQTMARLRQWTDNVCFSNVTTMHLFWCAKENSSSVSFKAKEMKAVRDAFPKLKDFTYAGSVIAREALQCLFMEMTQLTALRIRLDRTDPLNSDHWDSLLIGVPISALPELRQNPFLYWFNQFRKPPDMMVPSIRNLTYLETLELSTLPSKLGKDKSLISHLTFEHALLEMSNLKKIFLSTSFQPSQNTEARLKNSMTRMY